MQIIHSLLIISRLKKKKKNYLDKKPEYRPVRREESINVLKTLFTGTKLGIWEISHGILINKLLWCCIRGILLNWVRSYPGGRQHIRSWESFCQGVWTWLVVSPRGHCWVPNSFFLYINGKCKVYKILKLVLFADDTHIYCSGETLLTFFRDYHYIKVLW